MAYSSFFSGNSGTTKVAANTNGNSTGAGGKGGYKSFFGTQVKSAPTSDELSASRKKKQQDQQAVQQQKQQKQQVEASKPKPKSLLSKVGSVTKDIAKAAVVGEQQVATGVARSLPGGTNDLKAQANQANQATKNIAFAKKNTKPEVFKKLTKANTESADAAKKQNEQTIKAMPSKGRIALGAASTAADILTAGTVSKGVSGIKGAKTLKPLIAGASKKKAFAEVSAGVAANATAGGLNAAAGGGNKSEIVKNAAAGAVLPIALRESAHAATAVTRKAAGTNTGKTLLNAVQKPAAAIGKDKATTELIANTKTGNLLKASDTPVIKAKVDTNLVADGVVAPTVKQSKISELNIDASTRSKIDNKKVSQYEKQIKDGESIEPVVVQNIGGKTVVVDGEHRLEAARKLGITDVPTVEKVAGAVPTSKATSSAGDIPTTPVAQSADTVVPSTAGTKPVSDTVSSLPDSTPKVSNRQQTEYNPNSSKPVTTVPVDEPVIKAPETGQSRLAASTEQKAIDKKLTAGFEGKPEYAKVNVKDQAAAAHRLHATDPGRAERIALGKELPPEGLLPESVYIAVENQALKNQDIELLRRLATESSISSEATGMGQRIRMLAERDPDSAVSAMRKVRDDRLKALEKKTGKTLDKVASTEIKAIRAAKPKVTKETWGDFIESIKC